MAYKTKKAKQYVRVKGYFNLVELKKGKNVIKKDYSTTMPVERDAIGRILIYNKEGKILSRKPEDFVEINGKRYPID